MYIHMCIHVNITRGKENGDPLKIPALLWKSAHGDAPNESRAHTGSSRVVRAGPGQVVIRHVCLHRTPVRLGSWKERLGVCIMPLCVSGACKRQIAQRLRKILALPRASACGKRSG